MAQLVEVKPEYLQGDNESFEDYLQRTTAIFEELRETSAKLQGDEVVGGIYSVPIADGQAMYVVVKENPLQLMHIPFFDGYQAPYPHIVGLGVEDVRISLRHDRSMEEMFSTSRTRAVSKAYDFATDLGFDHKRNPQEFSSPPGITAASLTCFYRREHPLYECGAQMKVIEHADHYDIEITQLIKPSPNLVPVLPGQSDLITIGEPFVFKQSKAGNEDPLATRMEQIRETIKSSAHRFYGIALDARNLSRRSNAKQTLNDYKSYLTQERLNDLWGKCLHAEIQNAQIPSVVLSVHAYSLEHAEALIKAMYDVNRQFEPFDNVEAESGATQKPKM